jgi:hypothetical protein
MQYKHAIKATQLIDFSVDNNNNNQRRPNSNSNIIMARTNNTKAYKAKLVAFMSYRDNIQYDNNHSFTCAQLLSITPDQLLRWMCKETYGTETPGDDDRPKDVRANTLEYWKKALSSFMIQQNMPWNCVREEGNPTRSKEILDLIKKVKKAEVRKEGAPSQARRPATMGEMRQVHANFRENSWYGHIVKYGCPAFVNFQVHYIRRIDCTSQFTKDNFQVHDLFPDLAGNVRLNWAKNVHEERDAPWQIMLGSMDPTFCVLLSLAIWLEFFHGESPEVAAANPYVFAFKSDDFRIPEGGDKTHDFVMDLLTKLFRGQGAGCTFKAEIMGLLGSHSFRKFSSTHVRNCGATKDEKDGRGCWLQRQVSDTYDDTLLRYPDAKVAKMLCIGGACSYRIKEGSGINDEFILQHVTPNIHRSFGAPLAKLLGRALLWVTFSDKKDWVPSMIAERINSAYAGVMVEADGENPIEKRLLTIVGHEAQLVITEISATTNQQGGQQHQQQGVDHGGNLHGQTGTELLMTLVSQQNQCQQQMTRLHNDIDSLSTKMDRMDATNLGNMTMILGQFRLLRRNWRDINIGRGSGVGGSGAGGGRSYVGGDSPAGRRGGQEAAAAATAAASASARDHHASLGVAELTANPKDLITLWEEYQNGVGHRKAARLFTPSERGRAHIKHKYHRRKIVWDVLSLLVNANVHFEEACERIYTAYPGKSLTAITSSIKKDKKNNTLPASLTVGQPQQ